MLHVSGWDEVVSIASHHSATAKQEHLKGCSFLEIAAVYKSRMARTYGTGYRRKPDPGDY